MLETKEKCCARKDPDLRLQIYASRSGSTSSRYRSAQIRSRSGLHQVVKLLQGLIGGHKPPQGQVGDSEYFFRLSFPSAGCCSGQVSHLDRRMLWSRVLAGFVSPVSSAVVAGDAAPVGAPPGIDGLPYGCCQSYPAVLSPWADPLASIALPSLWFACTSSATQSTKIFRMLGAMIPLSALRFMTRGFPLHIRTFPL
ncbi:hypothetical protein OROGR_004128 [Orobanche gracilis]